MTSYRVHPKLCHGERTVSEAAAGASSCPPGFRTPSPRAAITTANAWKENPYIQAMLSLARRRLNAVGQGKSDDLGGLRLRDFRVPRRARTRIDLRKHPRRLASARAPTRNSATYNTPEGDLLPSSVLNAYGVRRGRHGEFVSCRLATRARSRCPRRVLRAHFGGRKGMRLISLPENVGAPIRTTGCCARGLGRNER
jgi:hypothetical protein